MYCTKCGQKLTSTDIYCSNCGTKIIETTLTNNQEQKNDTLALILSIISLITFYIPIISVPLAIISIINIKKYYKETNKKSNATTISIISIILSILYTILIVGILILVIDIYNNKSNITDNYEEYFKEKYEDWNQKSQTDDIKIEGKTWQGTDSSILKLEENKIYNWYSDKNNYYDNFHQGNYEYYTKYAAIKYIALNLPEYNLTEEEQLKWFKMQKYDINNYIVIILNCKYSKMNGQKKDINNRIVYYGFYNNENKSMSLINIDTNNKAEFTLFNEGTNYQNSNII